MFINSFFDFINLIDKLLEKDPTTRISCADESFTEYFNDNDMSKEAFSITKINKSQSTKKANKLSVNMKPSDVKKILENLKSNNKK